MRYDEVRYVFRFQTCLAKVKASRSVDVDEHHGTTYLEGDLDRSGLDVPSPRKNRLIVCSASPLERRIVSFLNQTKSQTTKGDADDAVPLTRT